MKNAAMAAAIMTIIMAFCYGIPFCRAWHIAAQYTILMIISPFLTVCMFVRVTIFGWGLWGMLRDLWT